MNRKSMLPWANSHGQFIAVLQIIAAIVSIVVLCFLRASNQLNNLGLSLMLLAGASVFTVLRTKRQLKITHLKQEDLVRSLRERSEELASYQQTLDLQKRILQSVLDNIAEAVVVFKSDGTLLLQNPAAINLFSAAPVGTHFAAWNEIIGLIDPETLLPLSLEQTPIALALQGKSLDRKLMVIRKTQTAETVYVTVTGQPMLDEKLRHQGAVITYHDVTEQVQSEMALRRAKTEADSASRSKSEFLANMSHEIRTPMTAILGYADMLLMSSLSQEQRRDKVQIIRRNGRMLMQLIEDILDISRIEAGRTDIEKVQISLQNVISEIYSLLNCRAQEQKINFVIQFEGGVPRNIFTAPVRLRQILVNVIGNAIKFTEVGEVKLVIRYLPGKEAENGLLEFMVSDTGCGIPGEAVTKLFSPFVQVDTSSTRRYGGSGLGLALAGRLATALGGELRLESSQLGEGSTFVASIDPGPIRNSDLIFDMTMRDILSIPPESNTNPSGGIEGIKVLVIEDSHENRELFSAYLEAAGAEVATAKDGEQGLETALRGHFDVVLTDIQMPKMDGYQVVAALKEKNYPAPIIALTAHAMEDEKKRCLGAGFDYFLTKPIDPTLLVSTIRNLTAREKVVQSDSNPLFAQQILDKEKIVGATPKIKSIFARFVQSIPVEIEEMKRAVAANDWEKLMSLAHKFQGTAGNCGFLGLMDQANQIQETIKSEQRAEALGHWLKTLDSLGRLSALEFERLTPQGE